MIRETPKAGSTRRNLLKALAFTAAAPAIARFSPAQAAWPADKPVRFIVPFGPAGPSDIVARVLAQGLGELFPGSTFIVENKAGAGGNIGMGQVARSEPDGYTYMSTSSALTLNPSLYEQVPFDPIKDFEPVALPVTSPNCFVADPKTGIRTLADMIARCKAEPERMNYASPGAGTTPQLSFELLKIRAGIKPAHVAFGGAGPAVQSLLSSATQIGCVALPAANAQIKAGTLVGLALTSGSRWHDLPDVPTMKEVGFDDFLLDTKTIIAGPAGTPPAIVNKLAEGIDAVIKRPATQETMLKNGFLVLAIGPNELRSIIAKEVPMWRDVVAQAGVKLK